SAVETGQSSWPRPTTANRWWLHFIVTTSTALSSIRKRANCTGFECWTISWLSERAGQTRRDRADAERGRAVPHQTIPFGPLLYAYFCRCLLDPRARRAPC